MVLNYKKIKKNRYIKNNKFKKNIYFNNNKLKVNRYYNNFVVNYKQNVLNECRYNDVVRNWCKLFNINYYLLKHKIYHLYHFKFLKIKIFWVKSKIKKKNIK